MEIAALVLSIISIILSFIFSLITIIQNKKLHNENKTLNCRPNLQVELLWDDKIGGQIIKKEYAIDSYNVWEAVDTPFYVDGDIYYDGIKTKKNATFTIFIQNTGFGTAKEVKLKHLKFKIRDTEVLTKGEASVLNNISVGQKIAKKIFCIKPEDQFDRIEIEIQYLDLNGKEYITKMIYLDSELNKNLVLIEEK